MSRPYATVPDERLEEARIAFTTLGPNKTSKQFGMSPNTFRIFAKRQGWVSPREQIIEKQSPYTQQQIDEIICRDYPLLGAALTKILPFSAEKIRKDAIRLGVQSKWGEKLAHHEQNLKWDYFDTWSDQMARDLGYLWADGSIGDNRHDIPDMLVLHCHRQDEAYIIGLRERLGSQHNIHRYDHLQESGTITPMTMIGITGRRLAQSLVAKGLVPRKSELDGPFPNVPQNYLGHFTGGYFEGDGCAGEYHYTYKPNKWILYYKGSHKFIRSLSDHAAREAGVTRFPVMQDPNGPTCSIAQWQNPVDIRKLYDFMYPPGQYQCISRKRGILEQMLGINPDLASTSLGRAIVE